MDGGLVAVKPGHQADAVEALDGHISKVQREGVPRRMTQPRRDFQQEQCSATIANLGNTAAVSAPPSQGASRLEMLQQRVLARVRK